MEICSWSSPSNLQDFQHFSYKKKREVNINYFMHPATISSVTSLLFLSTQTSLTFSWNWSLSLWPTLVSAGKEVMNSCTITPTLPVFKPSNRWPKQLSPKNSRANKRISQGIFALFTMFLVHQFAESSKLPNCTAYSSIQVTMITFMTMKQQCILSWRRFPFYSLRFISN